MVLTPGVISWRKFYSIVCVQYYSVQYSPIHIDWSKFDETNYFYFIPVLETQSILNESVFASILEVSGTEDDDLFIY